MTSADWAWLTLVGGIAAYEVYASLYTEDQLLSEGYDRYLVSRPIAARLAPILVALHLINFLPKWLDPLAAVFLAAHKVVGLARKVL